MLHRGSLLYSLDKLQIQPREDSPKNQACLARAISSKTNGFYPDIKLHVSWSGRYHVKPPEDRIGVCLRGTHISTYVVESRTEPARHSS